SVLCAISGEISQVKNLAPTDADHRYHDPMPRLTRDCRFIRPNFTTPGVRANGCQIPFPNPIRCLKPQPGRIASCIAAPLAGIETALHLAGTENNKISALYFHALRGRTLLEFIGPDAITVLQAWHTLKTCNVQKHSASDHLVFRLFDAVFVSAAGIYQSRVIAIPHFLPEKNVSQRVPL